MNVGRQSRRRRGNRGTRPRTSTLIRYMIRGAAFRGRFDPPRIIATPWNSVVLCAYGVFSDAGTSNFTFSSLATVLRTQLGLVTTQTLSLRFRSVGLWSTPSDVATSAINVALRASDLNFGTTGYHQWIEDAGTTARPSHVHWAWSAAESEVIYVSPANDTTVVFQVDHTAAFSYIVHVHVLWKSTGGDTIPTGRLTVIPELLPDDGPFEELLM